MSIDGIKNRARQIEGVVSELNCLHQRILSLDKKYRCDGRCTNILLKISKIFADATSLLCNEGLSSEEICYLRSEKQQQECMMSTLISCKQCRGSLSNLQSLLLTEASQTLSATSQLASLQVRAGLIIESIRTVVDIYEI